MTNKRVTSVFTVCIRVFAIAKTRNEFLSLSFYLLNYLIFYILFSEPTVGYGQICK